MSHDPIDRAMRAHFREQHPDPAVLARMRNATTAADRGRSRQRLALAAAAAVALTLAGLGIQRLFDTTAPTPSYETVTESAAQPIFARIADEVAMNHRKNLDLEFVGAQYEDLDREMTKLEFTLASASPSRIGGFTLAGGRYCSIQGQLAAQLRLERDDGRRATLYQTHLEPPLTIVSPQSTVVDGVRVSTWVDGNVFFALATDAG